MPNDVKIWKISNTLSSLNNKKLENLLVAASLMSDPTSSSFLLNTMTEPTNLIEKFIQEIYEFHMKRLNMEANCDNIFVEFFFVHGNSSTMHLDCDEYDKVINKSDNLEIPFLSTVTYLNDNDRIPTVITDVDKEMYKFKDFSKTESLYLSLPEKMKHICFNGGEYCHGRSILDETVCTDEKMDCLVMTFWKTKPLNIPRFDYEYFSYKYAMKNKEPVSTFVLETINMLHFKEEIITNNAISNDIFSEDFLTKLFYNGGNCHAFREILKFHEPMSSSKTFRFEKTIRNTTLVSTGMQKLDVGKSSKFSQRGVLKKVFSSDVCKWIINEAEEYATNNSGWLSKNHKNFPTIYLPVEFMQSVLKFALVSFQETIVEEISNLYSICLCNAKYHFEIKDVFILKYGNNETKMGLHTDDSCITLKILLSDENDFKGGGITFGDDITYYLNKGDTIIYSGLQEHDGIFLSDGKRYELVFLIDILEHTIPPQPIDGRAQPKFTY
jgi:hypothetical protein